MDFITDNYKNYIKFLKELAAMPSVFSTTKDVEKAIMFCKRTFKENLNNYIVYSDKEKNLVAVPKDINPAEDIVYLSAHIDTVNADPKEWDKPFHPWKIYEDKDEIVGRGVSDCKAGVAYQLFLSFLAKKDLVSFKNLIFTVTFKEEGSGEKTVIEIAKEIGKKIPVSKKSTYLIVLENNVTVDTIPTLGVYTSERGNFVAKITDTIPNLQKYLMALPHWNPVCIKPQIKNGNLSWKTEKQSGGHVCSVDRDHNLLTKIILNAEANSIIKAGSESSFSVMPTEILIAKGGNLKKHSLIINNRFPDSAKDVLRQLHGIKHEETKRFSISEGFDIGKKFKKDKISKILEKCRNKSELKLEYTCNVGASDATAIYASINPKIKPSFFPIVMGPGSRSQRNRSPQRLTHGINETFHKESGKRTIIFITKVLRELKCLAENERFFTQEEVMREFGVIA